MTNQEKDLLIHLLAQYTVLSPEEKRNEKLLLKAKADVEHALGYDVLDTKMGDTNDGFPTVMTIPQMAKFLQIGISKAYEMSHWVGFPAVRIGRQVRVPKHALLEWLEQQQHAEQEQMQLKTVWGRR